MKDAGHSLQVVPNEMLYCQGGSKEAVSVPRIHRSSSSMNAISVHTSTAKKKGDTSKNGLCAWYPREPEGGDQSLAGLS